MINSYEVVKKEKDKDDSSHDSEVKEEEDGENRAVGFHTPVSNRNKQDHGINEQNLQEAMKQFSCFY